MAYNAINVGTNANDGTGDALRSAFVKCNTMFSELYTDETSGEVNSITATAPLSTTSAVGTPTLSLLDAGVTFAKMQNVTANSLLIRNANSSGVLSEIALANTQILIGDGSGMTATPLAGDVTMTNAGVVIIGSDKVTYDKMQDTATANRLLGAVSAGTVGEVQVTTAMITDDNVTIAKMANDSVGADELVDNSISAIALNVSGNGTLGQALTSDADGSFSWSSTASGDITEVVAGSGLTGGGATASVTLNVIGGTAITADANDVSVTAGGIGTTQLADDGVTYAKMQDTSTANRLLGAATAGTIGEVQVATDMVADSAITNPKINFSSGAIVVGGNGSTGGITVNDGSIEMRTGTSAVSQIKMYCEVSNAHFQTVKAQPHSAASSAVLTLPVNTGTLIGTGDVDSVSSTMMAANSIDSDSYVDGSIDTIHIADSQITVGKMADNSIDSDQYVDGSIDTIHIADSQVTVGKMAADSVDSAQYVNGSIDTEHIADDNITFAKLEARYTALVAGGTNSSFAVNWADATTYSATSNGNATYTFSNAVQGQTLTMIINGNHTQTFAETGSTWYKVGGVDYDGSGTNIIQVLCGDDSNGAKKYYYTSAVYVSDSSPS